MLFAVALNREASVGSASSCSFRAQQTEHTTRLFDISIRHVFVSD